MVVNSHNILNKEDDGAQKLGENECLLIRYNPHLITNRVLATSDRTILQPPL